MGVNLVLFKKSGSQKSFPLYSTVTVIGRRKDCDLHVPLSSVSRRHCQLNRDRDLLKIRDLGSRNGTLLNGRRVNESPIRAGDRIEVGPLTFLCQINGQPASFSTTDISVAPPAANPKPNTSAVPQTKPSEPSAPGPT